MSLIVLPSTVYSERWQSDRGRIYFQQPKMTGRVQSEEWSRRVIIILYLMSLSVLLRPGLLKCI